MWHKRPTVTSSFLGRDQIRDHDPYWKLVTELVSTRGPGSAPEKAKARKAVAPAVEQAAGVCALQSGYIPASALRGTSGVHGAVTPAREGS